MSEKYQNNQNKIQKRQNYFMVDISFINYNNIYTWNTYYSRSTMAYKNYY